MSKHLGQSVSAPQDFRRLGKWLLVSVAVHVVFLTVTSVGFIARGFKAEGQKSGEEKTWDWGRAKSDNDENSEIWEDELGSFKANLYDNCSSKERFLALRVKKS